MFFERSTQSSMRHRRLKYLLLFTLRFLLLLLIVFAFANPFLRRRISSNDRLLLIVLDNSFSMRAGTRFADAKKEALKTVSSKPRLQQAQIIALGGRLQILTTATTDPNQLISALNTILVGDGHASFADLGRFVHTISESSSRPIELHLFSDMQRTAMPENFAEAILPVGTRLTMHPMIKGSPSPNWTVDSVDAPPEITDPKDLSVSHVKAVISGFATAETEKSIALVVNGRTIATRIVHIPASGRAPVEFAPIDVNYGFNRCEIRIEGSDSLSADDTARFVIRRTDPSRILFVHSPTDQRSPLYFGTAINAATHGAFLLQSMIPEQTTNIDPKKFAFVVLSDSTSLPPTFEHALEEFASRGGNVFITLGFDAERGNHIPLWGGSIQHAHDYAAQGGVEIGQIDFTFPALEQDKPGRDNGGWAATKVLYSASVDSFGARVAAKLSDGTPLLLTKRFGEGHILIFSSGMDNLSNNLPLQPVFVHFVDKTTRYLSDSEQFSGSRTVDSFVQLRSSTATAEDTSSAEVIDPESKRPLSLNEARTAQTFQLTHAGFYQIRLANGRNAQIGVNPNRKESDLTPMSPEMQELWTGASDSHPNPQKQAAAAAIYHNLDLWWYIMLLALGVAIAETFFSNRYLNAQREEI